MTLHNMLDVVRDDTMIHIYFSTSDMVGFVMRAPAAKQLRVDGEIRRVYEENQNIGIELIGSTIRPLAPFDNLDRIEQAMVLMYRG